MILKQALGISSNDPEDLNRKLVRALTNFPIDDHKDALAVLFNLPQKSQEKTLKSKFLSDLCEFIFKGFWVILLDDLEFADPESYKLFQILMEMKNIFCVFTLGKRKRITEKQANCLRHYLVYRSELQPIEISYHKTIACQFLKVSGISLELERLLHLKSNGNPGWMISCLTTLRQSNKITIHEMTVQDAITSGVAFVDRNFLFDSEGAVKVEEWDMYKAAYNDDPQSLEKVIKSYAVIGDDPGMFKVAILNESISHEEKWMRNEGKQIEFRIKWPTILLFYRGNDAV